MPAVATLPAKPRRRKPVAEPSGPILRAVPATAGANPKPGANVTPQISPIKKLQAHLDKLQALYIQPNPGGLPAELSKMATWARRVAEKQGVKDGSKGVRLPSAKELNELGLCIEGVAQQLEISKAFIPYLHGVIKHIGRRYPKTGLEDFVAKLVKKITALPVPISTRIVQALADCKPADTTRKAGLRTIQDLLKSRHWTPRVADKEWMDLYPLLAEFASDHFKALVQKAKPKTMQEIEYGECRASFQGVLGFAAFHDLQRQHLLWMLDYEPKVVPVAMWIHGLQNEEWDRELRKILHGSAATPAEMKQQMKTILASQRKKRWRKAKQSTSKSVDKKPLQPILPYKKRGHRP